MSQFHRCPASWHLRRSIVKKLIILMIGFTFVIGCPGIPWKTHTIHEVAALGNVKKVSGLLHEHPEMVNAKDNSGWTPLHWTAPKGHKEVAELLLTKGANVNAKDNRAWTPLHAAAVKGQTDVVELLRQHGGVE